MLPSRSDILDVPSKRVAVSSVFPRRVSWLSAHHFQVHRAADLNERVCSALEGELTFSLSLSSARDADEAQETLAASMSISSNSPTHPPATEPSVLPILEVGA